MVHWKLIQRSCNQPLRIWIGKSQTGWTYLQYVHFRKNLYTECRTNTSKSKIRRISSFLNVQRTWKDASQKQIYEWRSCTWKHARHQSNSDKRHARRHHVPTSTTVMKRADNTGYREVCERPDLWLLLVNQFGEWLVVSPQVKHISFHWSCKIHS